MNFETWAMIRYLRMRIKWLFRIPLLPWRRIMHCEFEPTLQLECLKSAVEIARERNFSTLKITEGIEHLSCFSGCAAAYVATLVKTDPAPKPDDELFPRPDGFKTVDYSSCSIDEICDQIEDCCPKGGDIAAVDWSIVFNSLLPLVIALLQKFINR